MLQGAAGFIPNAVEGIKQANLNIEGIAMATHKLSLKVLSHESIFGEPTNYIQEIVAFDREFDEKEDLAGKWESRMHTLQPGSLRTHPDEN